MKINNREKAREIASKQEYNGMACWQCKEYVAMQMAQWKDEQFDEEKKELLGLVNMLPVDDHNQTIIEDLIALLR